jgi:polyisoprenoid-binding protein YceI
MKKMFVLAAAGLLFNVAAIANGPGKNAADKTLKVDPKASTINWGAKKVTGTHAGTVPLESGTLVVDNDKLKGGSFVADIKSLVVTDVTDKEMNGKLTNHLKSDDFFSVEKHPQAKLVISQDVKFPATVTSDAKKITANAKVAIDRTKYDIKFRSTNFFENLGDKAIDNDFTLDVNLVANK